MAILYFIVHYDPTILHKKFQVILSKIEGVTAIFAIFDFFKFFFQGLDIVTPLGVEGPQ